MFARPFAALTFLCLLSASSPAAPIAYEPFNGTAGATIIGTNGGVGWAGAWVVGDTTNVSQTFVTQPLSYTAGGLNIQGGGSALRILATGNSPAAFPNISSRPFPAQGGPLWVSFLFQTPSGVGLNDDFFQLGLETSPTTIPRMSVGNTSTGGNNTTQTELFARASGGTGSPATDFTGVNTDTDTYFLVARLEKTGASTTYNQLSLFVNPTSASDEGTPLAIGVGNSTLSNLDDLVFRLARLESGDAYFVDEIRLGTTYADVIVPAQTAGAVPEPATLAVFAACGCVAAVRVRRRRAA